MVVAALVVSIVALTVGVLSLGWQVYAWKQTGPVITVKTQWAWDLRDVDNSEMATITAHNSGRSSVQLTQFSFRAPNGYKLLMLTASPLSDRIDRPLEGGHEATHYFDAAFLRRECAERGLQLQQLKPQVRLGTGRAVVGRKSIDAVQ